MFDIANFDTTNDTASTYINSRILNLYMYMSALSEQIMPNSIFQEVFLINFSNTINILLHLCFQYLFIMCACLLIVPKGVM